MSDSISELTPKRRSILWSYRDENSAMVIAIKNDKLESLRHRYENPDSIERQRTVIRNTVPVDEEKNDSGRCVFLNEIATRIWENCDGVTTVQEIADSIIKSYKVDTDVLYKDICEFLIFADDAELVDRNWRSQI